MKSNKKIIEEVLTNSLKGTNLTDEQKFKKKQWMIYTQIVQKE